MVRFEPTGHRSEVNTTLLLNARYNRAIQSSGRVESLCD